jgi:hypothetical protein
MEPGGIGNADRLPARILRSSASRLVAVPADAEQPTAEIPVDSAHISPAALEYTVREGLERAQGMFEAAEENPFYPPAEAEEIREEIDSAVHARSDNLAVNILCARLMITARSGNSRTVQSLFRRIDLLDIDLQRLDERTLGRLVSTARELRQTGHLAEARQLYTLVAGIPTEGLSEEQIAVTQRAQAALSRTPTAMPEPLRTNAGETIRFATLHAQIPQQLDMPLPIRDPEIRRICGTRPEPEPNLTRFVLTYIQANPALLEEADISNLAEMTPRQAARLASHIVGELLTFEHSYVGQAATSDTETELQILQSGRGVCRHYVRSTLAVFEVLRGQSQSLRNSYMFDLVGHQNDMGSDYTEAHAWCIMATQVRQGEWIFQAVDPTSHDHEGSPLDVMLDGEYANYPEISYALQRHGIISGERTVQALQSYIDHNPGSSRIPFTLWQLSELNPGSRSKYLATICALGNTLEAAL